jgi:hypothetical protein
VRLRLKPDERGNALLIFGSLARAPSKECGRCLLMKFGLAQFFTARLFWRFGEQWHLAVNIFGHWLAALLCSALGFGIFAALALASGH